jgi:hypothetical protein
LRFLGLRSAPDPPGALPGMQTVLALTSVARCLYSQVKKWGTGGETYKNRK